MKHASMIMALALVEGCAHTSPARDVRQAQGEKAPGDDADGDDPASASDIEHTTQYLEQMAGEMDDDDPQKPGVLHQLADAYVDGLSSFLSQAENIEMALWKAEQSGDDGAREKLEAELVEVEILIADLCQVVMKTYRLILDLDPGYGKRDEVLFALALIHVEIAGDAATLDDGNVLEAKKLYSELIDGYPSSKHLSAALVAMADFSFAGGDMAGALELFTRVSQQPDGPVTAYALYKKAWCHINMEQAPKALDALIRVIEFACDHPDDEIASQLQIQARKDLPRPFSSFGKPQDAWELFSKYGGDLAISLMESLAQIYEEGGRHDDAVVLYDTLMKAAPDDEHFLYWQAEAAASP